MHSNVVGLLGIVVALSAVCLGAPAVPNNYGAGSDPDAIAVVNYLLQNAQHRPIISPELAHEYTVLESCYNGTFSELKLWDHYKNLDVKQQPLYQHCHANRDRLLDSLWYKVDETYGARLLMPVYPLRYLEEFVVAKKLEGESPEEQLAEYRKRTFLIERIKHFAYCREMVDLIDVELAEWGLEEAPVASFLETKTKQPIGKALGICRMVVNL